MKYQLSIDFTSSAEISARAVTMTLTLAARITATNGTIRRTKPVRHTHSNPTTGIPHSIYTDFCNYFLTVEMVHSNDSFPFRSTKDVKLESKATRYISSEQSLSSGDSEKRLEKGNLNPTPRLSRGANGGSRDCIRRRKKNVFVRLMAAAVAVTG